MPAPPEGGVMINLRPELCVRFSEHIHTTEGCHIYRYRGGVFAPWSADTSGETKLLKKLLQRLVEVQDIDYVEVESNKLFVCHHYFVTPEQADEALNAIDSELANAGLNRAYKTRPVS